MYYFEVYGLPYMFTVGVSLKFNKIPAIHSATPHPHHLQTRPIRLQRNGKHQRSDFYEKEHKTTSVFPNSLPLNLPTWWPDKY
jgi:hypothetical protein